MIDYEEVIKFVKVGHIELKPSHARLCFPIIVRIYKKMLAGIKFRPIKVDDGIIIDGHHRYLASVIAKVSLDIHHSHRTSATEVYQWSAVQFDHNDWDTESKIAMLNQYDAEFNEISIEKLNELLN
jgi:hypothetical protein